jgi:hypothetical protein
MIEYTYEDVLQSLKTIVHGMGEDYIYPRSVDRSCVYYEGNGEPSCLVGHFLYENELVMAADSDKYEDQSAETVVRALEVMEIASFDARSSLLLQRAQECQDYGVAWGDSLNSAIEAVTKKFGV